MIMAHPDDQADDNPKEGGQQRIAAVAKANGPIKGEHRGSDQQQRAIRMMCQPQVPRKASAMAIRTAVPRASAAPE